VRGPDIVRVQLSFAGPARLRCTSGFNAARPAGLPTSSTSRSREFSARRHQRRQGAAYLPRCCPSSRKDGPQTCRKTHGTRPSRLRQLADQLGGAVQSGPEELTVAGKPGAFASGSQERWTGPPFRGARHPPPSTRPRPPGPSRCRAPQRAKAAPAEGTPTVPGTGRRSSSPIAGADLLTWETQPPGLPRARLKVVVVVDRACPTSGQGLGDGGKVSRRGGEGPAGQDPAPQNAAKDA
jgi:hypothetical protein